MKLRGDQVILWKRDRAEHKTGMPYLAPDLASVGKYRCAGCEKVFYYNIGDPETPQYAKGYPLKSKRYNPYCHKCWHRYSLKSRLHSSGCWLCDLRNARQAGANGIVRRQKSIQETGAPDGTSDLGIEPTTAPWKQSGVRRSTGLSSRRGNRKDKANRKSRR